MLETLTPYTDEIVFASQLPAVYVIHHKTVDMKYVGSTSNMYKRWVTHQSKLRHNKHGNQPLQDLYNIDPNIYYVAYYVKDREHAYDLEQALIDYYAKQGKLLNIATNARTPTVALKGRKKSPEHLAKMTLARQTSNAGAPKRQVCIRGVVYPSVRASARGVGEPFAVVQRRLNDDRFPEYAYIEPS